MPPIVLAHAGHWFISVLYLAPVVVIVGALVVQRWRDDRHVAADAERDEPDAP